MRLGATWVKDAQLAPGNPVAVTLAVLLVEPLAVLLVYCQCCRRWRVAVRGAGGEAGGHWGSRTLCGAACARPPRDCMPAAEVVPVALPVALGRWVTLALAMALPVDTGLTLALPLLLALAPAGPKAAATDAGAS